MWPTTQAQRCWVHKTANVLNKLPNSLHAKAKRALHDIWMADTRKDAEAALDVFIETYSRKYEKAAECVAKDRDALLAFSRRTLETLADHKPNRERICYRPSSYDSIEGLPLQQDRAGDDLQARASCREELAPSQRLQPLAESHLGSKVQRRN